jgi:hypothetical protein
MTNSFKSALLFASAFAVVLTASSASARIKIKVKNPVKSVTSAVNSTVNTVTNTTTTLANNVSNTATDTAAKGVGYANFAAAQAKGYANTELLEEANLEAKAYKWSSLAAADTASEVMGFKNYAARMDADSLPVGAAEYSVVRTVALNNYRPALSEAANKYEVARKNLVPVLAQGYSVANYVANTCKSSATGSWGKITPFVNKAKQLNPETQEAVFRLLRTLARGSKPDQQTATDMLAVGQALGMVSANGFALVGNAYQSNFSISVGGSGGWVAGVNSSVGFAMDTFPTNGKYGMAITVSTGVQVAAGTSALSPGATIGFGLGWGPGSAAGAEGQTLTAGGEVGGIDVAAQWTLPPSLVQVLATDVARNGFDVNSLKNALTSSVTDGITAMCQAPGISAGVSIPSSANLGNVTFSPGYTFVAWKGSF